MEGFRNLLTLDDITAPCEKSLAVVNAAWHGLFWLVFANCVGVLLAILLLFPALNLMLAELTYGRWIMVHMNIMLYGWTSLPLVGFLFRVYGADRGALACWCRPVLWAWSAALAVGVTSWLSGHSSGKLFLDWSGYARVFFPLALAALFLLLLLALIRNRNHNENASIAAKAAKLAGLFILAVVPFLIYSAPSPDFYPAINPDTGGPTGASQLESSLGIVAVMLVLPFGLARRKPVGARILFISWLVLITESGLCALLGTSDISHRVPAQYLSLGTLLVWMPLMPAYYGVFAWHPATRRWRIAFLWWWSALVVTGWIFFLPGVLDHFKFTDGLVGHSFVAMAGFTSSLIIFASIQLIGEHGWIFNRRRSFYAWNLSVIAYILIMTVAGWREGFDATFTIVPGPARNLLYAMRLLTGVVMLLASLDWLVDGSTVLRRPRSGFTDQTQEKAA
jgi:cytochrome c oxidase cbb3-type subunit 1